MSSYTLGANVEKLTHTGGTAIAITGNGLDNVITGNTGADTLIGLAGNDRLIGGGDTLISGKGDDVYIDGGTHAIITELANEGIDTLAASVNTETLAANVEKMVFIAAGSFHGTGNALNNVLAGAAGNDILEGLKGNDTVFGGLGNGTFRFNDGDGKDVMQDFAGFQLNGGNPSDVIEIHTAATNIADVTELFASHLSRQKNGVLVSIDADNSILLLGCKLADLQAGDFFVGV